MDVAYVQTMPCIEAILCEQKCLFQILKQNYLNPEIRFSNLCDFKKHLFMNNNKNLAISQSVCEKYV